MLGSPPTRGHSQRAGGSGRLEAFIPSPEPSHAGIQTKPTLPSCRAGRMFLWWGSHGEHAHTCVAEDREVTSERKAPGRDLAEVQAGVENFPLSKQALCDLLL